MANANVVMVPGWQERLQAQVKPYQSRLAEDIHNDVRQDIGANHFITGELFRSVHRKIAHPNRVYIGTDHWQFIEYGTSPHRITVQNARVLTDRTTFFGTSVNHPGTPEFRPMRNALFTRRALRG